MDRRTGRWHDAGDRPGHRGCADGRGRRDGGRRPGRGERRPGRAGRLGRDAASATPLTALAIAGLLAEAGVPDGVVNVLPSRKSGAVVSAMLNDPRVRKLSFTGSTEVGRILLREAAETVVNTSMELGGNAPFIILEDAHIDADVEAALSPKMRDGGGGFTAAQRFYVHEAVADEFSRAFAARLDAMT